MPDENLGISVALFPSRERWPGEPIPSDLEFVLTLAEDMVWRAFVEHRSDVPEADNPEGPHAAGNLGGYSERKVELIVLRRNLTDSQHPDCYPTP